MCHLHHILKHVQDVGGNRAVLLNLAQYCLLQRNMATRLLACVNAIATAAPAREQALGQRQWIGTQTLGEAVEHLPCKFERTMAWT